MSAKHFCNLLFLSRRISVRKIAVKSDSVLNVYYFHCKISFMLITSRNTWNWEMPRFGKLSIVCSYFLITILYFSSLLVWLQIPAEDSEWTEGVPEATWPLPPPTGGTRKTQTAARGADSAQYYPWNPNGQGSSAWWDTISLS